MEDWKKYYMIKEELSQQFNPQQWKVISEQGCQKFLQYQQELLHKLMKNPKIYDRFFRKFYNNHVKLVHWYMLATRNKKQMEEFVFKPLVNHRITFYNEKIKDAIHSRDNNKNTEREQGTPVDIKAFQEQLMNDFFKDLMVRNVKQNCNKSLNLKLFPKNISRKSDDNNQAYQIYVKTFEACNGRKYIHYDHQKHMKGMRERFKYNAFLRSNQSSKMFNFKEQSNDLSKFEQFQQAKMRQSQRCAMLPFYTVLKNNSLNSQSGLRNLMKLNKSQKLVFTNHLGKPITYKLAKPFR